MVLTIDLAWRLYWVAGTAMAFGVLFSVMAVTWWLLRSAGRAIDDQDPLAQLALFGAILVWIGLILAFVITLATQVP